MSGNNVAAVSQESVARTVTRFGYWAAVLTSVLTLVTFVVAFLTPPLSGPGCTAGCFQYPYSGIASRFPHDYWWMYLAMVQVLAFFAMVVAVHHFASRDRRVYSHLALGLALVGMATLFGDYFVQLAVVQPSLLLGEHDGLALLTQFNPHGVFIALEEVGYVMIALALLALAPVFTGKNKVERALRWIGVSAFALTVLAFAYFTIQYGLRREYLFEIAVITIDWFALIPVGILLAVVFRRAQQRRAVAA